MTRPAEFRLPAACAAAPRESEEQIGGYLQRLWPLNRSLTGEGVRRTHDILAELVPLQRIEIPSGTRCFDWTVPPEWQAREAYIVTPDGRRIADLAANNLHLLGYSVPFRGTLGKAELDQHLYSRPDLPDAIPYLTSYYTRRWGFCLPHRLRESLPEGDYQVVVDTSLGDGSMTLSEAVLAGESTDEVLISTYTCHPSMANNELSGPLVAAFLYRRLAALPQRRYTYRFVFLPETIGSIAYLARVGQHLAGCVRAGYVASCAGDPAPFTLKRSRIGDSLADRAALHALQRYAARPPRVLDFSPSGSDERQYCSPGFNLPVAVIARSIYGAYTEYHTSLDNLDFVSTAALRESVDAYFTSCMLLEHNRSYVRTQPYCEPHLGSRGLYSTLGGQVTGAVQDALMWLLNLADGSRDLIAIAERSGSDFWDLHTAAQSCLAHDLLRAE